MVKFEIPELPVLDQNPPVGKNAGCPPLFEEKSCNNRPCPDSLNSCDISDWSDWSECSVACGGGTSTRNREILNTDVCKNIEHDAILIESKICNAFECGENARLRHLLSLNQSEIAKLQTGRTGPSAIPNVEKVDSIGVEQSKPFRPPMEKHAGKWKKIANVCPNLAVRMVIPYLSRSRGLFGV